MVTRKPKAKAEDAQEPQPESSQYETKLWSGMHAGPAPLANRMGLNLVPYGGVRLSFAEEFGPDEPIQWRAGVTLSDWHAYQLFTLLRDSEPVQKWIEWAQQQNLQTTVSEDDLGSDQG